VRTLFDPGVKQTGWTSPADIYRECFKKSGSSNLDERSVYTIIRAGAGPSALANYESIAAARGVQMQTPFLDQQFVEYARKVPFAIKGKHNSSKYVIRELCREFVSPEYARIPKGSFILPFEQWLRADLWPIVEGTCSRESIARRGIFDYDAVWKYLIDYKRGASRTIWVDVWALVVIELWLRYHCDPAADALAAPSPYRIEEPS
jgi:asparagine synthase (glutamine-hydrolysing)